MGKTKTFLWALLLLLVIPSARAQNQNEQRPTPGASSSSNKILEIGNYVEIDSDVRDDLYGTIDFPNKELKDIVVAISKLTNKNFILDRKLENRRITIISQTPVTKQEVFNAFLSALYMNNLTVVSTGKFLKIIEVKAALQSNTRVFVGDYAPNSEEIVTVLYTLKNLNAEEIQRFVTEMVPRTGRVTAYPDTNTLVMTDTGINLRRVISVLKSIDVPGHQQQLESIPILYGSAKEIAKLIDEILDAQSGGSSSRRRSRSSRTKSEQKTRGGGIISKIVPDERTNSLVVLANGRGIRELKELISSLDKPGASGSGNIHIYYCKHALAEELAETLNSLLSAQKNREAQDNNQNRNRRTRRSTQQSSNQNQSGVTLGADIKVTADKGTNSLVVVASGADFASLKNILLKLDIPRKQVFVETVVMEIKDTDASNYGIGLNLAQPGVGQAGGFLPTNIAADGASYVKGLTTGSPTLLNGLVAGIQGGGTVTVGSARVPTVLGLIRALEDNQLATVLYRPQILTSDNQEAEIKVNTKLPIVTQTTDATSDTTATNVTFEDVTTSLKITPQIGEDNELIKLKVEQQVDDFTGESVTLQRTRRSADTTVSVKSGSTVVIGGLGFTKNQNSESKFPLLGDLPVIGWLFKGSNQEDNRSVLTMFLTPHVINEYTDLLQITQQKILGREQFQPSSPSTDDKQEDEIKKMLELNKKEMERAKSKKSNFAPAKKKAEERSNDESSDAYIQMEEGEISIQDESLDLLINDQEDEARAPENDFVSPADDNDSNGSDYVPPAEDSGEG